MIDWLIDWLIDWFFNEYSFSTQVRRCAQHGGIGVIAFPDPIDYAFEKAYPEGRGLPSDAVIRDFASPLFGDPRTPSLPSISEWMDSYLWLYHIVNSDVFIMVSWIVN